MLQIKATKHSNIILGSISEILRKCPCHALVTTSHSSIQNEGSLSFLVFVKGACSLRKYGGGLINRELASLVRSLIFLLILQALMSRES